MKPRTKAKRGRPSKFNSINLNQVKTLALKGWTDSEMADFFKVTEQTWNNWKPKHKDFFESLKDWKKTADERVERSLYERATGYEHPHQEILMAQKHGEAVIIDTIKHYPPDTTAAIFWFKNRQPAEWRDKQELDVNQTNLPAPSWVDKENDPLQNIP